MTVCLDSRITQHKTHIWYVKQDLLKTCFCMAWSVLCSFHQNTLNIHEILTGSTSYSFENSWYKFPISGRVWVYAVHSIKHKLVGFHCAANTKYKYLVNVSDQLLRKAKHSGKFLRMLPGNCHFLDCLNFLACSFLLVMERRWGSSFCDFKIPGRLILDKKRPA